MAARSISLLSSKLAVVIIASGCLMIFGGLAPADPPKEKYVFVENTDRWVSVFRGEWELIGKLDKNGDFIHEYKLKAGQPASVIPASTVINSLDSITKPKKIYEYRSGMLIPGELQLEGGFGTGRFVPEAGGKIIPFKEYEYSSTATPIWNLPGVFVTEEEAAKLKKSKQGEKK